MFLFERQVHATRREGELPTEAINTIWMETQQAMFGKSVALTPAYAWWWSYIPHFIRSPFYVYSYAFGELLSLSLYKLYKEDGAAFVPKYLELLAAGGSKSPHELVKPFGIKLSDKAFWQAGIAEIGSLISELEKII
jgi:oligoendopeptidase F